MKPEIKKQIILHLPYLMFVYLFDKVAQAFRLAQGADLSAKLMNIGQGFSAAFANAAPSFNPMDLLIGVAGAVIIRLVIYSKQKNAKKYRKGMEYGTARWGTPADIKPFIDPVFENNVLLTQTERLMMSNRPKEPKNARNKNILVIGGSGSGKTRFFAKPNLMQLHSSYVITDPKGSILIECGQLLQRAKYKIKVLNTINFSKSMHYNPFSYEDLPILPQEWKYTLTPGKENQFAVLKELMHRADVSELVNACDAGREGELIFRFVYEQADCRKPFKRLWISSMEDSAIREGMDALKDGREYDPLYQSALCRARADWLVGINATRLFSVLYHKTLNVGRVLSPTLNLLVEREGKIFTFKKEKYHIVHIGCGGADAQSKRITDAAAANGLKAACEKSQAVCVSLTKEKKTAQPPKLYDLTSLQREANRTYGFTAKQTLDYAQALYEKRLLTYPRTDSNYITSDMEQTATDLVSALLPMMPFMQGVEFSPEIGRVVNNAKVTDHHAILPTAEFAKSGFTGLAESEKKLLSLICCKLFCAVAPPHVYEAVTAVFECGGEQFTAKGKNILAAGWKGIDARFRLTLKGKPDEEAEDEATLPELAEGQTFENPAASVSEHYTTPPKPYTEDTLLSAMESAGKEDMPDEAERKGLGTPATRAAMIEKLLSAGFVERKGKSLVPTKDGVNLAVILPDMLKSPQLTAEWENRLTEIAKGSADPDEFMDGIADLTRELVKAYSHITEDGKKLFAPEKEAIGICPRCKSPVYSRQS